MKSLETLRPYLGADPMRVTRADRLRPGAGERLAPARKQGRREAAELVNVIASTTSASLGKQLIGALTAELLVLGAMRKLNGG